MIYEYCAADDECIPINFRDDSLAQLDEHFESYLTWAGNDHAAHVGAYYDHLYTDVPF